MKAKLEFVMRKFLIPLLLAGAIMPTAALAQDSGHREPRPAGERGSESGGQRERTANDRPQRAERVDRVERSGGEQGGRSDRAGNPARINRNLPAARVQEGEHPVQIQRGERPAQIERVERPVRIRPGETNVEPTAPVQHVESAPPTGNNIVDGLRVMAREQELRRDTHRDQDSGWSGNRDGGRNHHWSSDWRRDHRYDWRNHRHHHRSLFRLGRYYDPYGWGYRRFSIGYSLWPSYYGSSFWLNDPWQYRLPPAYGPYRWVRYYNDALLINIYTGQVVDVIYSFFW